MNVADDDWFKEEQGKGKPEQEQPPHFLPTLTNIPVMTLLLPILYLCFLISLLHALRMFTKTVKRCPSKHHHRRRRQFSMFPRINISISTCRRYLLRLFSNLTGKGFKAALTTRHHTIKFEFEHDVTRLRRHLLRDRECPLLPPMADRRRTVFLDLDETLIHSCPDPPPKLYDFIVRPKVSGKRMNFYVLKRPGLDKFLAEMSKNFEVVVFTAGVRPYAKLVLDQLDPKGVLISHRLYRDSCRKVQGGRRYTYTKDLSRTGRDLRKVALLDDNPNSYSLQPENAVPIEPFVGDVRDRELERLMEFFQTCDLCEDMRDAIDAYFHRSFCYVDDNLFHETVVDL